jgi:hypothetical protein
MPKDRQLRENDPQSPLPMSRVLHTWWPLALSWLLMAAEGPSLSAVVARLADPEVNLAAFGGIVYPLALIVESPIIMLLSASTALSKDWDSYRKVRRFMMWMGAILTAIHVLVAFTPLYDVIVVGLINPPEAVVEPARLGLMIMTPWTWAIAYRRFQQGVLIRFGHSRAVSLGTAVRLGADGLVMTVGYLIGDIPGIVVATAALAISVTSEAIYAGLRVRPVLRDQVRPAPPVEQTLTLRDFLAFYVPLAMTSLLRLMAEPLSSAGLSRMPQALASLAVWSPVTGFIFLLRSMGMAYSEVVIALLDEPRSSRSLHRFMLLLTGLGTALLLIVTVTPLATFWFGRVAGLSAELARLSHRGLWFALLMPGLNVIQSWYQGALVHSRRTRGITEAVVIYLVVSIALLAGGVWWGQIPGLFVGLGAISIGRLAQTIWLWHRSRPAIASVQERDEAMANLQAADASA